MKTTGRLLVPALALLLLPGGVLWPTALPAQDEGEAAEGAAEGTGDAEAVAAAAPDAREDQRQTIHRLLEQSEEVLAGRGFSYDPAGRRDPFRSLLKGLTEESQGPRPKGIAGMLINEVDLVGIVTGGVRTVAFFNGTDNRGYFLSVGDSLFDGKVTGIDPKEGIVVFRQKVDDPRSIKPYREVQKRLNPVKEEGI